MYYAFNHKFFADSKEFFKMFLFKHVQELKQDLNCVLKSQLEQE